MRKDEASQSLRPALASIEGACAYLGGIGRAKFYADILPKLETVKLGRRNFVVVASLDRLIEAGRTPRTACSTSASGEAATST